MLSLIWTGKEKDIKQYLHGDNLLALKALLLQGQACLCVYIDPLYNTSNENRVYNDNVNAPKIKKWLEQVVGEEKEDLARHDRWLCIMYPRFKLLWEDRAIFSSTDDNKQANLKLISDEVFGGDNLILFENKDDNQNNDLEHEGHICQG
jgi:adenine-specific DNA-methyltransferase